MNQDVCPRCGLSGPLGDPGFTLVHAAWVTDWPWSCLLLLRAPTHLGATPASCGRAEQPQCHLTQTVAMSACPALPISECALLLGRGSCRGGLGEQSCP